MSQKNTNDQYSNPSLKVNSLGRYQCARVANLLDLSIVRKNGKNLKLNKLYKVQRQKRKKLDYLKNECIIRIAQDTFKSVIRVVV